MKAVITADIVNSSKLTSKVWNKALKTTLETYGKQGKNWEIYRGDEIQLLIQNPEEAFFAAIKIKTELKKKSADARISIGLGDTDFVGSNIKESNGTAFVNSGRNLEELKNNKLQNLSIKSENKDFDQNFNLIFLLLEQVFEKWTVSAAKALSQQINNLNLNQTEISEKLGISQGAFSRALKRANFDAVMETDQYFRKKVAELK